MRLSFKKFLTIRVLPSVIATLMVVADVPWLAMADDFPQIPNTEKATTLPMAPEEVCKTVSLPPGFELRYLPRSRMFKIQLQLPLTTEAGCGLLKTILG